jgi:hypothetical protein
VRGTSATSPAPESRRRTSASTSPHSLSDNQSVHGSAYRSARCSAELHGRPKPLWQVVHSSFRTPVPVPAVPLLYTTRRNAFGSVPGAGAVPPKRI